MAEETLLTTERVLEKLAKCAQPDTEKVFGEYTDAVRQLIDSCIYCYGAYPEETSPDPNGDSIDRTIVAYKLLRHAMRCTLDKHGKIREGRKITAPGKTTE